MSSEIMTIDNREDPAVRCRLEIRQEGTHWVGSLIRLGRNDADNPGRLALPFWATTPQQARQQLQRLALSLAPSRNPAGVIQRGQARWGTPFASPRAYNAPRPQEFGVRNTGAPRVFPRTNRVGEPEPHPRVT